VTRLVLCAGLSGLTLVVALLTAIVQSHNRDMGQRLNDLREETSLIEAVNGAASAQIIELDHGPMDVSDLPSPKKGPAR
jgi:hypothetical protein